MKIEIVDKSGASAVIDTLGAELKSFVNDGGFEFIWNGDENYWSGSAPFLFPIASNARNDRVAIDGVYYPMPMHGFARQLEWEVLQKREDRVTLSLSSSKETKAIYPFDFSLTAAYTVKNNGVSVDLRVKNQGDGVMPFCLGTHPGFKVPFENSAESSFEDYSVIFEKPETGSCPLYDPSARQIDVDKRVSPMASPTELKLTYGLFREVGTVIFDRLSSSKVTLKDNQTGHCLTVSFTPFPYLALWTPEAPFLCIEPWQGLSVCSDEGDEFSKKRGAVLLNPGEEKRFSLAFEAD